MGLCYKIFEIQDINVMIFDSRISFFEHILHYSQQIIVHIPVFLEDTQIRKLDLIKDLQLQWSHKVGEKLTYY